MNWSYIAAVIDCDGTIIISKKTIKLKTTGEIKTCFYPQIIVGNTSKKLLNAIQDFTKLGYIYKTNQNKNRGYKTLWMYGVYKKIDVKYFIKQILPYLIIKKDKAREIFYKYT